MSFDLQRRRATGRRVAVALTVPALLVATAGSGQAVTLFHAIAVGKPDLGPGALDYFRSGSQVLTEEAVGLGQVDGQARFGAAVAVVDLDHDQYEDLVVGAPGSAANPVAGRVDLLFGTATGITAARAQRVSSPGLVGDEFGAAIATGDRNQFDVESVRDLWIGAPGTTVDGHANAGAVYRYSISATGVVALVDTITQDSPLVPGVSEAGDRFGEVLSPSQGGALVGVPHEDIGRAKDAGAMINLRTAAGPDGETPQTTPLIAALSWNQNSPGVPGTAEAGDRFGAAVSGAGFLVGVPGEDVGRLKDAGIVQTFTGSPSGVITAGPAISQDSAGVPGSAEAGDQFGAAVTQGWYTCDETDRTAIGAPGEDLRGQADAGSVTLLAARDCPATALSQGTGHGLKGAAEAGDRVGTTLATVTGNLESENNRHDNLLIGAPGEDITSAGRTYRDTGRVYVWGFSNSGSAVSPVGGDFGGLRYGSYLSSEVG